MEAVMEYCVDEYETLCGKNLRDDELEIDQIFVPGGERVHSFYAQYLYICATRALHELGVFVVN